MHNASLISMWIHLLAATVWIGGMLFIVMVLAPTLRHPELRPQARLLLQTTGKKFKRIGWACLLTLIVTGCTNIYFMSAKMGIPGYTHMLATKIVLVLIVIVLAIFHDLKIGPAAIQAMEKDPDSEQTKKVRKKAIMIGRINLLLSLIIMTLALFLVRGLPQF